jgi:hypothetical protein
MNSNPEHQIIKLLLKSRLEKISQNTTSPNLTVNFDELTHIILEKLEKTTGCKLYNKDSIIKELETSIKTDELKLMDVASNLIDININPEISYDTMFSPLLDFTFNFCNDEVMVFYKNKKVELKDLESIQKDLLTNQANKLPPIVDLYVENIIMVAKKLINKDITVKYNLINIPKPYWKLYEIKCKKSGVNMSKQLDEYRFLETIMDGTYYASKLPSDQTSGSACSTETVDPELAAILMEIEEFEKKELPQTLTDKESKELENHYQIEIMSYLNDDDLISFFEIIETIKKEWLIVNQNSKPELDKYMLILFDLISKSNNKMINFYIVDKLLSTVLLIQKYIEMNNDFYNAIVNKIIELQDDFDIFLTTGLEFSKKLNNTIKSCKIMLDSIGKSKDPSYVSKFNSTDQAQLLIQATNS